MKQIRIDPEVFRFLQETAARENQPFVTPNMVMRFIMGIDKELKHPQDK